MKQGLEMTENMSFDFGYLEPSKPTMIDTILSKKVDLCLVDIEKILDENPDFDVNTTRENGETLLHYACYCSWYDLLEVLLGRGGDINKFDSKNRSPLGILAHGLNEVDKPILKKCLEYGGDVRLPYIDYESIVRKAKHQNRYAIEVMIDHDLSLLTLKGSSPNLFPTKTQFSEGIYNYLMDNGKLASWQSQIEIIEINKEIDLYSLSKSKPRKRNSV